MNKYLQVLLFFLASFGGAGDLYAQKQGQYLVDSLMHELPATKDDTSKVKLLTSLSFAYEDIDPQNGINYGKQDSLLAEKLQWKYGIAQAYEALGVNYRRLSKFDTA